MKNQLKESILEKRNSLSKEELLERSKKIQNNLFNLDYYKKSKTTMFFVSFNSEVHTHEMIKDALRNKTVIIPKVAHSELEPSVIIDFDNLIPAKLPIKTLI